MAPSKRKRAARFQSDSPPQDAGREVGNAKRRALLVPKEITHRQSRNEIKGPGRKAPVKHPVGGRHFVGLGRPGLQPERRSFHIEHPLAQAKNENARRKSIADVHRIPGEGFEHGLGLTAAQADVAVPREEAHEGDRRVGDTHEKEKPGQVLGEEVVENLDDADRRRRNDDDRRNDGGKNEGGKANQRKVYVFEHDGGCGRTPKRSYAVGP